MTRSWQSCFAKRRSEEPQLIEEGSLGIVG